MKFVASRVPFILGQISSFFLLYCFIADIAQFFLFDHHDAVFCTLHPHIIKMDTQSCVCVCACVADSWTVIYRQLSYR